MWSLYTVASIDFESFDSQVIGKDQYDVGFIF